MSNEKLVFNNPEKIDVRTAYGKGLEPKIEPRTAYGKGIYFKGDDGQEYSAIDEVRAANKRYWDGMKIDTSRQDSMISYIGNDGREYHTSEDLERVNKAYFDYINSSLNLNAPHLSEIAFKAQQEKILAYIHERYGDYFEKLLQEYGLENLNNNRSPKK